MVEVLSRRKVAVAKHDEWQPLWQPRRYYQAPQDRPR